MSDHATNPELAEFLAQRNAAFRTLDVAYFRDQCPEISHEAILPAIHKARYECAAIEDALRVASGEWLRTNGYCRMNGQDWPPPGELPK